MTRVSVNVKPVAAARQNRLYEGLRWHALLDDTTCHTHILLNACASTIVKRSLRTQADAQQVREQDRVGGSGRGGGAWAANTMSLNAARSCGTVGRRQTRLAARRRGGRRARETTRRLAPRACADA